MQQINPNENNEFHGRIKDITNDHLVQKAGRHEINDLRAHVLTLLDYDPASYRPMIGDYIEVKYRHGRGLVKAPKDFEPPEHKRELSPTPSRKKKSGHER